MIRIFCDTLYVGVYIRTHIHAHTHTHVHTTTVIRVYTTLYVPQPWRAYVRKCPDIHLLYLALSLSRCYPMSLFSPPYTLSSSLSVHIYIYISMATLSVTNPHFQPPAAVVVRSPRQVESGAFPPPTNGRRETPPWSRGRGDIFYP